MIVSDDWAMPSPLSPPHSLSTLLFVSPSLLGPPEGPPVPSSVSPPPHHAVLWTPGAALALLTGGTQPCPSAPCVQLTGDPVRVRTEAPEGKQWALAAEGQKLQNVLEGASGRTGMTP